MLAAACPEMPDPLRAWTREFLAAVRAVEAAPSVRSAAASAALTLLADLMQGPPAGYTALEYRATLRYLARAVPEHECIFTCLVLHGILRTAERRLTEMIGHAIDAETAPVPSKPARSLWAMLTRPRWN